MTANVPVVGKGLPKRVEKVREEDTKIDLEKDSVAVILEKKKKQKAKSQAKTKKEKN